ncbi:hypothetical protein Daesc_010523 [Daldinia eschscholtzii]|uniref:Uncharacterized protein n=1 Tax=Daldinia eschscholtzii TaxID=292717 RepID=A0AAX6M975_9PEZI
MVRNHSVISVYDTTPYHAYCLSDNGDEDDDVCVWDEGPELIDLYDSEDERIVAEIHSSIPENERVFRTKARKNGSPTAIRPETPKKTDRVVTILEKPSKSQETLTDDELQERKVAHALSTTRTNLTRISQFILKLECRTGKVTKEGIKQTLDATVANGSNAANYYSTYQDELEAIQHLSESTWQRLYLIDRHWRRQSNLDQDAGRPSSHIELESEPGVKAFLKGERQNSHLTSTDPCYYTAYNLVNGRRFEDWIAYLKNFCEFKDNPTEETKLVHLAWRFLDRDLRGPRPSDAACIQDYLDYLNNQYESGAFDEAIKNPRKREQDDDEAWGAIKKFWFTRFQG